MRVKVIGTGLTRFGELWSAELLCFRVSSFYPALPVGASWN